ncbi:MAG TPA: L28 family ribosomal protein [Patescibacteria group bacterium]
MPKSFTLKYPVKAHVGHKVSHAKNRTSRVFKNNLHTVTVVVEGQKQKMRVPSRILKQLKKAGITTHWKKPVSE